MEELCFSVPFFIILPCILYLVFLCLNTFIITSLRKTERKEQKHYMVRSRDKMMQES